MTTPQPNSSRKPRLLLLLSTFPQPSETFIVNKFLGLLDRGWDVHILCHRVNHEAWVQFPTLAEHPQARTHVHQNWPTQPRWLVPLLFFPALMACLFKAPQRILQYLKRGWAHFKWNVFHHFYLDAALIALKPDIVHFEFGALAVGRTHLKKLLDLKLSVSFRGYDLNFAGLEDPDYYQGLWKTIDGYHVLSDHLRQRAINRGCSTKIPFAKIPPAVDFTKFSSPKLISAEPLGSSDNPLKILSVGRLEWKKGYELALKAARLLVDQGWTVDYRIIGGGEYQHALYFARHQLSLEKIVTFEGSLTHTAVLKALSWADVFLHPSLSEGFCNAVLEAQAMGLPVVCTDAGGLPENVQDGVTGFVVPRRDPAAMAERLARLASDGELRRTMGTSGRKRVEIHFRMEDQLNAFEEFYAQL
jgi:colanic acid/amylovoran biosynthesis glycosyltransferase